MRFVRHAVAKRKREKKCERDARKITDSGATVKDCARAKEGWRQRWMDVSQCLQQSVLLVQPNSDVRFTTCRLNIPIFFFGTLTQTHSPEVNNE